ncbi:13224_t:CDS:2 [Acaulospora morrowiae]|uniref:13224_t:CDS:1 n=1 Tax=Acaulospora morrowiae TaxID=94023 RepID=A0A9N8VGF4_9GLOM|nr:13224_t:CDS:2 [Acaulospora morrowiae]
MSSKDWYFGDADSDNYDEESDEDFVLCEDDVPPDTSDTSEDGSDDNYEPGGDFDGDNNFDGLASSEYDDNQDNRRGDNKKGKQVSKKSRSRKRSNGIGNGDNHINEPHTDVNEVGDSSVDVNRAEGSNGVDSSNCADSSFDVTFINDMNSSFSNGMDGVFPEDANGSYPDVTNGTNDTFNGPLSNSMNGNVNGISSNGSDGTNGLSGTNGVNEQGSPSDRSQIRQDGRRMSPSSDNSQVRFAPYSCRHNPCPNPHQCQMDRLNYPSHQFYPPYFPPNYRLRKLDVPFQIFSEQFNEYHEEQESELKQLEITERKLIEKKMMETTQAAAAKRLSEKKKSELKTITDRNKELRDQVEDIHRTLLPILNDIMLDDNQAGVTEQLNALTVGPYLLELAKKLSESELQP